MPIQGEDREQVGRRGESGTMESGSFHVERHHEKERNETGAIHTDITIYSRPPTYIQFFNQQKQAQYQTKRTRQGSESRNVKPTSPDFRITVPPDNGNPQRDSEGSRKYQKRGKSPNFALKTRFRFVSSPFQVRFTSVSSPFCLRFVSVSAPFQVRFLTFREMERDTTCGDFKKSRKR